MATYLNRSCYEAAPQCLVTLNFPRTYYGQDITKRLKYFTKLMKIQLPKGTDFTKWWNYDPNVDGYFPHIHLLIRCTEEITHEMVHAAWTTVWDKGKHRFDKYGEAVCVDVSPIVGQDQLDGAIVYMTKHGLEDIKWVKHWSGPMQGGDRKFLVDTISNLMTKKSYRLRREEVAEATEASELERSLRWFLERQHKGERTPPEGQGEDHSSLLDITSLIRLHLEPEGGVILVMPQARQRNSKGYITLSQTRRRREKKKSAMSNKELWSSSRSRLRYCIWPRGP